MNISTVLTRLLKEYNLSEAEVARRSGLKQPTVHRIKVGQVKSPEYGNVKKIAKVFSVTPAQLRGEEPIWEPNSSQSITANAVSEQNAAYITDTLSDAYQEVPVSSVMLSAGKNGMELQLSEEESNQSAYYQKSWLKRKGLKVENLFRMRVTGSSMEPALFSDDIVLVDRGRSEPAHGKVFALQVDGEPLIKRIKKLDGIWWITSDNKAHSNQDQPLENTNQIIGAAVEKSSTTI